MFFSPGRAWGIQKYQNRNLASVPRGSIRRRLISAPAAPTSNWQAETKKADGRHSIDLRKIQMSFFYLLHISTDRIERL